MQGYEFLPHTADVKFQAFGESLEQAFEYAAYALTHIICSEQIKPEEKKTIKVSGRDRESLLYNFLEEFLYLLDTGGFLVGKVKNIKISGLKTGKNGRYNCELSAEVYGDDSKNYETEGDVKAITYNDMFIKAYGGKFVCQVVVDV